MQPDLTLTLPSPVRRLSPRLNGRPGGGGCADPHRACLRLGELRDAGLITPEEFESKKAEILARIWAGGRRTLLARPPRSRAAPHVHDARGSRARASRRAEGRAELGRELWVEPFDLVVEGGRPAGDERVNRSR
jgi:Short C-terminal domain